MKWNQLTSTCVASMAVHTHEFTFPQRAILDELNFDSSVPFKVQIFINDVRVLTRFPDTQIVKSFIPGFLWFKAPKWLRTKKEYNISHYKNWKPGFFMKKGDKIRIEMTNRAASSCDFYSSIFWKPRGRK